MSVEQVAGLSPEVDALLSALPDLVVRAWEKVSHDRYWGLRQQAGAYQDAAEAMLADGYDHTDRVLVMLLADRLEAFAEGQAD